MQAPTQPVTVPLLVLGWGNLSRGDDGLGPLCVAALQSWLSEDLQGRVECLEDYQLQIEHALDLVGRTQVLFIDASLTGVGPFDIQQVQARRDTSYTSHALSPQALLQVYCDVVGEAAPSCTLLAIRGEIFALGQTMSPTAHAHLAAALPWAQRWIQSAICLDLAHA